MSNNIKNSYQIWYPVQVVESFKHIDNFVIKCQPDQKQAYNKQIKAKANLQLNRFSWVI